MKLDELFKANEVVTINRSELRLADYNPRVIDEQEKKELRKSIKKMGILGGIYVNKRTGNTIYGGNQKVTILDEMHKYNPATKENDYTLRVAISDISEKEEKEDAVLLNNPKAQGRWDNEKLRVLVTEDDFDYKAAGLDDADMSMIGVDLSFATEQNAETANDLNAFMENVNEQHKAEIQMRAEAREEAKQMELPKSPEEEEAERQAKIQAVKEVKQQVKQKAMNDAMNMDAYVVLSFSTYEAMRTFLNSMGYDESQKYIKGEDFQKRMDGFAE